MCFRTYYFYEFVRDEQHVALVATVNNGKVCCSLLLLESLLKFEYVLLSFWFLQAFIAGATAPQNKWPDDGLKLRSAAVSITVL